MGGEGNKMGVKSVKGDTVKEKKSTGEKKLP